MLQNAFINIVYSNTTDTITTKVQIHYHVHKSTSNMYYLWRMKTENMISLGMTTINIKSH